MKNGLTLIHILLFLTLSLIQPAHAKNYATSIGIEFIRVKPGCFIMGRDANVETGGDDELPPHEVCITRAFYLGETEVTQEQWGSVMSRNPSKFKGPNHPVDSANLDDVQNFIHRLNEKDGRNQYRLPTEAEWEYAARADSSTTYHFGDDRALLAQYAWFGNEKVEKRSHQVAGKDPNQWGFYDMHGNVWEWVQDWYSKNYYANSPRYDPKGPTSGMLRVVRGGSWRYDAEDLRLASRYYGSPSKRIRNDNFGFRLLMQLQYKETEKKQGIRTK